MAICLNCGKDIGNVIARNCPYCHEPITMTSVTNKEAVDKLDNDYDSRSNKFIVIGIFLPLIFLYLYFKYKSESPLKATSCLYGSMIGIIIRLALITLLLLKSIL